MHPEKCLMVGNDVSEYTVMEQLDIGALMPTDRLISGGLCYFRGNLQFVFIFQSLRDKIIIEGKQYDGRS